MDSRKVDFLKQIASVIFLLITFGLSPVYGATNNQDVNLHMTWCANDWGHNEGANEAISYANTAVSAGYPNQVSGILSIITAIPGAAGEMLKRPPVIDAARALVNVQPLLAVQLALTCQAHNPGVRMMLMNNWQDVADWLRG